jgi:hypothetical protein
MECIIASCGAKVCKANGWVCPYVIQPGERYSTCGVNIQIGTNRCLDALYEAEKIQHGNIDPDREFDFDDIE